MFEFYYGNEAEQFTFLRVPKFLFTDSAFLSLSSDAKILYSLMLDRMGLSVKSGWLDEQNRVYIMYTLEEAQTNMNCGHDKCTKIFAELEKIGLIYRKKRGMGRPALIYVKNFVSDVSETDIEEESQSENAADINVTAKNKTAENPQSRLPKNRSQDCRNVAVKSAENPQSRVRGNRSQECGKSALIKNNNIKTEKTETDDPYLSDQSSESVSDRSDRLAEKNKISFSDRDYWVSIAMQNASYDVLKEKYSKGGMELADEILNIIADVLCGLRKVYISGKVVPAEVARSRFMLLTCEHIEYVIDSLASVQNQIAKPDAYICTALYNATYTLNISTFAGFTANTGIPIA